MRSLLVPLLLASLVSLVDPADARAASGSDRPNILFIIFDDWGWNHAGAYGCSWIKTPNFDRVAREGVLFKNAFTSNPKCSPCRASILTGRNSWQLEEAACHYGIFPRKFAVYPELLEAAGYTVGLTGKGWGPGDHQSTGFTRNPAGPLFDEHTMTPPASGIARTDYAKNFASFLGKRKAGQPFCFWMGFKEPHRGYERHSGVRLGKRPEDVKVPAYLPDLDVVRDDLLDYAVEVESADAHIGRALEALKDAGELERTLIVVTSDHGMPFPRVKGQIYEDGFHLPLAIRWGDGIKPGRVVDDFINVRDFAPTFLELAGLQPHPQVTGRSLVELLRSKESGWVDRSRNVMLAGKERHDLGRPYDWGYPARAIRTPEFLYVHNYFPDRWPAGNPETDFGNCDPSPTKELLKAIGGEFYDIAFGKRPMAALYRLADDPECVRNLAADPAYTTVMTTLRDQMIAMLRQEQDPRALGNGAIFETYKYVGPRAKDYDTWLKSQTFNPPTERPVNSGNAPAKKAGRGINSDAPAPR
ncbi:sulfatase family protein [Singulisphaera acidiphila]|uniref:Arylsulfatase A family protein n=1 Tax=Singulisphaera acidiphila (strain ATCC BAA-1392 / DSM 18658 / VKM B-2454 / MOB10) TaxID=886293 RepID=L0DHC4_SINAD|nr:sulfatase [Singulisphaera acidiphila]AGA28769.1 arylsulfatase A family protein [Singulisphaera acidiphila DSM 18658]